MACLFYDGILTDHPFFFVPAQKNVGKWRHFIAMQKYRTVEYIYQKNNISTPTHNNQLEPPSPYSHQLFPPLSPWVQQRHHPITAPPLPNAMRRPRAVGIRSVLSVRSLGRAKREGSKNRGTSGGMPGP